ncbi:MAG: nitrous oxide reductase accessory protein NosL [Sulfuriferula sp.]
MTIGAITYRTLSLWGITTMLILALCGCEGGKDQAKQLPAAIVKGDTCAVCGMEIGPYPGPRAEAYVAGVSKPLKFGGTRDFFAYVTQPDNATRLETLYVQDCSHIDWAHPIDSAESFVEARKAYYVGWQPLPGEMGPTFASFARRPDAMAFIQAHGGALLRYDQITPQIVSGLGYVCPAKESPLAQFASNCVQKAPISATHALGTHGEIKDGGPAGKNMQMNMNMNDTSQ